MTTSYDLSTPNHGTLRVPWFTLACTGLMVVLYAMNSMVFEALVFEKHAILNGEVWRFFTGHLVHCNFDHLFWDLVAFLVLGGVIEMHSPKHLIPSFLMSCSAVGLWLLFSETGFATYCGLSGALNGLLVVAAVMKWKETEQSIFGLVLLGAVGKILYEIFFGQTIFTDLSLQAVPLAHAMGFAAGLFYLWCLSLKDRSLFEWKSIWNHLRF